MDIWQDVGMLAYGVLWFVAGMLCWEQWRTIDWRRFINALIK